MLKLILTPDPQDPNPVCTNLLMALNQVLHAFRLNETGHKAAVVYLTGLAKAQNAEALSACLYRYTFLLTAPMACNAFRDGFNAAWLTVPNKGILDTMKAQQALKFAWKLALPHVEVFHPVVG